MKKDSKTTEVVGSLTVRKQEIPVVTKSLLHTRLKFYPDNPRIYSIIREDGKEPSQETIYQKLVEQEHVRQLIQDIKLNGGLIEPLLVRDGTMHVLEGNSRLAAYRFLAKTEPLKWAEVKCLVLPKDVNDSLVFAILGQYHIKGKKDWAPFEQAGFLYRRYKVDGIDLGTLASEIGLSQKKIKHLIDTYQFMINHKQNDVNRWSYFDEYLKSTKIKKTRERHPELDSVVVKKINSGEIPRAVDVRDELPNICSGSTKLLNKFINGKCSFTDAAEEAKEAGSDNSNLKKLQKIREWLVRPDVATAMVSAQKSQKGKIVFELDKIVTRIQAVKKMLT
jgi:hypothetical protein